MHNNLLLSLNLKGQLVIFGQLFAVVYSVIPRLIRSEQKDLLKIESTSSNALIRPHEVKFVTEWSGQDAPLFNPSCIVNTPGTRKGNGLCITRYGGRCFLPESARKPSYKHNGRTIFYYGLAKYSFGASGHQVVFQNISVPEVVACDNDGHPRWFYFQKELYVISWSEACRAEHMKLVPLSRQKLWERNQFKNWIWKFGTNKTAFLSWDGLIDNEKSGGRRNAKNFLPFQNGAKLMAIVTIAPRHKVYEIDVSNGNMTLVADTPNKPRHGDIGLSAGPVVLDDRRLLVAAHIRDEDNDIYARRLFFYTCEALPPFRVLEETPLFYFTGDAPLREARKALLLRLDKNLTEKPENPSTGIEYGVQMQILNDELMLSMGLDDCDAAVITVPLSSVTSQLRTLNTGSTTVFLSSAIVNSQPSLVSERYLQLNGSAAPVVTVPRPV